MNGERGAVRAWLGVVLALVLAGAGVVVLRGRESRTGAADFVGREACVLCHELAGRAWAGSDHDWAMKPA
ncbi:MAG: hypothetical protein ACRD08_23450, partial [Acidimicrobiales bacterium]